MSLSLPPSIFAASHKAKECVCVRKKRSKESNTDLSHCQAWVVKSAWVRLTRLFFCQVWSPSSRCRLFRGDANGKAAVPLTCSWATAFAAFVCRDSIALVTCHVEPQVTKGTAYGSLAVWCLRVEAGWSLRSTPKILEQLFTSQDHHSCLGSRVCACHTATTSQVI